MTRKVNFPYARCRECNIDAICSKCTARVHRFSPFSDWLRALDRPLDSSHISNQNLDYIWCNFRKGWFITIEEKTHKGLSTPAQNDTHGIVKQFLEIASGSKINTMLGERVIEYKGHYIVRFENTNPDDGWMQINGKKASKEDLLRLLSTGDTNVRDHP